MSKRNKERRHYSQNRPGNALKFSTGMDREHALHQGALLVARADTIPVVGLSLDRTLDREDDRPFLRSQVRAFRDALTQDQIKLELYGTIIKMGATQDLAKSFFINPPEEIQESVVKLEQGTDPLIRGKYLPRLSRLGQEMMSHKVNYDTEGDPEIVERLLEKGYDFDKILEELIRTKQETIDLLGYQIKYLDRIKRAQKRLPTPAPKKLTSTTQPVNSDTQFNNSQEVTPQPALAESFPLSEWQMYLTDRDWSSRSADLIHIDSADSESMAMLIQEATKGKLTVSPRSLVRTLLLYLFDMNAVQRALRTRNSFITDETGRWIQIIRGQNVIAIMPDEKSHTAVFFAGPRDKVYRRV